MLTKFVNHMKRFCFWLTFAFFFISVKGWCTLADKKTKDYFVIHLTTEQQLSFAISEKPVITFEGDDIIVTTLSNSVNIPIQSVTYWEYKDVHPVVITANSYTREYGDANPVFEFTSEGAALDGVPEITCEATESSPVGIYDIVVKQGTLKNYNVNYVVGTLTVTKAPLIVSVGNYTREYGQDNPEFTLTYSDYKNGENESILMKKPTATTDATKESPIGDYIIRISGGEAQNYNFNYVDGKLTITEPSRIDTSLNDGKPFEVYNLNGQKVCNNKSHNFLSKGVYVVNGKVVIVK